MSDRADRNAQPRRLASDETTAKRTERRRSRRALGILGLLLGLIFAGVLGTLGWVLFSAQQALDKATNGHGGSVIQAILPGQPPAAATQGRYNLLIAGNTADDPNHPGGDLTDGIIVASINQATNKVTLVSVPRDLWVDDNGKQTKLNAVYYNGGRGEAGLNALGQVVERVTGLHIDNHVLVGNIALKGIVDTVGGVDVTIASPDPRGIGDPNIGLYLPNGVVHLDGATAMKLASARNDPVPGKESYGLPDSDYSRQQSQRLILMGIAQKVKSTPTLANPLTVVSIFNQLSSHLTTDLTAGQIKWLYEVSTKAGSPGSITARGERTKPLITDYTADKSQDALVPVAGTFDYSAIKAYVASMLAT